MSFYYGYNQIPMADFSYWQVWAAILFFVPLGVYGFIQFIKRNPLGLGILIWLGVMLGVINVFFPIVGIAADRYTYAFSLGFCIVVAYLLVKYFKVEIFEQNIKIKLPSTMIILVMIISIVYSGRTIARNSDWHDYMTLYTTDIEHLTESAKAHALLANTLYPMVVREVQLNPQSQQAANDVKKLIYHFNEALRIDSTYATTWNNLGSVYVNYIRDFNQAITYCKQAIKYNPNYLEAHFNVTYSYIQLNNVDSAYQYALRVVEIDPDYVKIYELFNNFLIKNNKIEEGINDLIALSKVAERKKNIYVSIANLYSVNANGNYTNSIEYFEKAYQEDPSDKVLCKHLANLHKLTGNQNKSNEMLLKCSF